MLRTLAMAIAMLSFGSVAASAAVQLDKITLPEGFKIEVWAEVEGARSMAIGDGFVIVGTMGDSVHAVPFDKTSLEAGPVVTVADDLKVANGVALLDGVLYIAEQPRLIRWGDQPFSLANPQQTPVKIGPDLVDKPHHGWRYLEAGPDGKLYVTIGSPCNVCMPEGMEGSILRIDPQTGKSLKIATGIRNSVGVAFHPGNGDLYFTDNGADMMGDDTPPEELNRLTEDGQNFGYPWFGGGNARTDDFLKQTPPAGAQFPVAEFAAHTAGLGITFYQGTQFPEGYRGDLFLAQHGSWNRTFPIGYRVMLVNMDEAGNVTGQKVFASGWLQRGRAWGRPVDVKTLPDGSLLVSDDFAGVIYRITYGN
jgi:glucose/arabinose dehydrogenase